MADRGGYERRDTPCVQPTFQMSIDSCIDIVVGIAGRCHLGRSLGEYNVVYTPKGEKRETNVRIPVCARSTMHQPLTLAVYWHCYFRNLAMVLV